MLRFIYSTLFLAFLIASPAQNVIIPLWEGDPPNYKKAENLSVKEDTTRRGWIKNVHLPDLAVYLPSPGEEIGVAAVICPGGGYKFVSYQHEGVDIAHWLNSHGIAAFVLKYRMPGTKRSIIRDKSPLLDAKRALRIVRKNSEEWNIDPNKIGIIGFSAGGHLASSLSTHFDQGDVTHTDPIEAISCRPDFSVLVYPVISSDKMIIDKGTYRSLLGRNPEEFLLNYYSSELHVTPETPPAILVHTKDDQGVLFENSVRYYESLKKNGIPTEILTYQSGGHGYSLAIGMGELSNWPDKVIVWINTILNNPIKN